MNQQEYHNSNSYPGIVFKERILQILYRQPIIWFYDFQLKGLTVEGLFWAKEFPLIYDHLYVTCPTYSVGGSLCYATVDSDS